MSGWVVENDPHWSYVLTLVEDFERLGRYVEISAENYDTYSTECTRLLLASCSEIEVVLKLATNQGRNRYLKDCLVPLQGDADLLRSSEIILSRSGLIIPPWREWLDCKVAPFWWSAYNDVKHDRSNNFWQASLKNCLYAICGLHVATLIYLRRKGIGAVPAPRLLRINNELASHAMYPYGPIVVLGSSEPGSPISQ